MRISKAAGALGANVEGVRVSALADTDFAELRAALVEHGVLFLRDQVLGPADLQGLAERFGPVMGHPAYAVDPQAPGVQVLESTAEAPSRIELWHSDMTFAARPPMATLLLADVVPAWGGDTLWASAAAAWQALSRPLQELLADMRAVHDFRHGFAESLAAPGGPERLAGAIADNPPVEHPVMRTHPESGRPSLYVNPLFTTRLCGLTSAESRGLLAFLYNHITAAEFTVRFTWAPGSLVIWDNRSTQHKPVNDYFPQHRRMLRVTIEGDQPS